MWSFCKKFKIISNHQFGFQPKISCIHALIKFTEYLRNNCDKNQSTQACFVDLKKAFDTLNHEVLLIILDRLGFRGIFHNLLKGYLTNRIQIVQNGKNRLSELNLTCGVPQGPVSGPLLFLLYKNDLTEVIRDSEIVLFADDTTIYTSGPQNSNQKQLSDDIERANEWFSENALTVNNNKCYTMIFGKNGIAHYNALGESSQKLVGKYLGIIIDNKLSFT